MKCNHVSHVIEISEEDSSLKNLNVSFPKPGLNHRPLSWPLAFYQNQPALLKRSCKPWLWTVKTESPVHSVSLMCCPPAPQTLDALLITSGLVTLVLEEDGTVVDTEEFFQTLGDNTHFMILEKGQKWTPVSKRTLSSYWVDFLPTKVNSLFQCWFAHF